MAKDFVSDSNPLPLYRAGLTLDLPDYLKDFAMPTVDDMQKLASSAFADRHGRLHPIYNKESVLLSGIYLAGTGRLDSPVMDHVKQAAEIFGVSEDLRRIVEAIADQESPSQTKVASSDNERPTGDGYSETSYAMLVEGEDSVTRGYYPIRNEVQLTKSARAFYDDFVTGKFPADWAHQAAITIVKKANELGLQREELPERVWVLGTERLPDFDTAEKMAKCRSYDGVADEGVDLYVELAKSARAAYDMGEEDALGEYLKLWSDLDTAHGVTYKNTYTPQEAFFTGPSLDALRKAATEYVAVATVLVPAGCFRKQSAATISSHFRSEIAEVIDSAIKLAAAGDCPTASRYIEALDEGNQKELLKLLND
jgi:hypothetical protein